MVGGQTLTDVQGLADCRLSHVLARDSSGGKKSLCILGKVGCWQDDAGTMVTGRQLDPCIIADPLQHTGSSLISFIISTRYTGK